MIPVKQFDYFSPQQIATGLGSVIPASGIYNKIKLPAEKSRQGDMHHRF